MQKFLITVLFSASLLGCSNLEFPGVYKIPIDQGNIVTQEMVDQLKPGMTESQVLYILGSPLLKDTFNEQRWDYLYSERKDDEPRTQYRMSVFFDAEGKLTSFKGDFIPSSAQPEQGQ